MDKIFGGSSPELNRIAQNLEEMVRQFANSTTKRGMVDFGATRRIYIGPGGDSYTCPANEPIIITYITISAVAAFLGVEIATIEVDGVEIFTAEIDKNNIFNGMLALPLYPGEVVDFLNADVTYCVVGVAASDV